MHETSYAALIVLAYPTSYGISEIMKGVILDSYVAIDHLLPGTYRGHMPKFRLISLKLNKILRFENFEIMRFSLR